jgi:uncharacterized protein (TIGR03437 family)
MSLSRLIPCGVVPRAAVFLYLPLLVAAQSGVSLQVSNEVAPAGGWAQFKVSATAPVQISAGAITMDFEPLLFGDISSVSVYSATGDQIGYANVSGRHLDAHFSSSSAGIGQLPGLPVLVVSIPVLATSFPGVTTPVSATATDFIDALGNPVAAIVSAGRLTVRGSLSVESVTPGGGILAQGTVLSVKGTGFTADTIVAIDGVAIASVNAVSPREINVILGGATELTGKHVRVSNADGTAVDYFCALPSASNSPGQGVDEITGVHPIIPLATYTCLALSTYRQHPYDPYGFALLNPNSTPVTVVFEGTSADTPPYAAANLYLMTSVRIQPGGLLFLDAVPLLRPMSYQLAELWITASAPIRMVTYQGVAAFGVPVSVTPPPVTDAQPPAKLQLPVSPTLVLWTAQQGAAPPAPASVVVSSGVPFSVSVPGSAAAWLSVSGAGGTAPATLTFTPHIAGLGPGTYTATVTLNPVVLEAGFAGTIVPATVSVSLTISGVPQVGWTAQNCCFFFAPGSSGSSPPNVLTVTSNGAPVPFTASVTGGDWLTVTPLSGTTPANLTLNVSPAGLADGTYSAQLVIQGPSNSVTVPVTFFILSGGGAVQPPPAPTSIQLLPTSVSFLLESGSGPPATPQVVTLHPSDIAITTTQAVIQVNASAANLWPGTYTATITATSGTLAPVQIPVTLVVVAAPTPKTVVTATPSVLTLNPQVNQLDTQTIAIDSGGVPILVSLAGPYTNLLSLSWTAALTGNNGQVATPATLTVRGFGSGLPGTYKTSIKIAWDTRSLTIPVTLNIPAQADFPPIIAALVNAASQVRGAVAPGEIVTLYGTGLGPVFFNGQEAQSLYESSGQVNVVVPASVGSQGTATVKVVANGVESQAWEVPLDASAPAIFTAGATGVGPAAGTSSATRGGIIRLLATGAGSPPFDAPKLTMNGISAPAQVVTIGSGVQQVSAIVPPIGVAGPAVPVTLTIGGKTSPAGVTISVQ